jgi:hypothetical protein
MTCAGIHFRLTTLWATKTIEETRMKTSTIWVTVAVGLAMSFSPAWAACPKGKNHWVENTRRQLDEIPIAEYSYDVCGTTPNGPFRESGVATGAADPGLTRSKLIEVLAWKYQVAPGTIEVHRFKQR